ncbi:MAG TPA: tetratricopeptide repeat protein, partial [Kofleriaceae bacterium]|nr:tetratricopeptide repeat protein [Kofleriaceae bacterium]
GEFDAALADVERALVLDPNNVTARPLQVDLLQVLDRIDEAISRVEALVELLPERASVHATRARLLVQVGRVEEGAAASERALELSGREYDVLSQHALLLVNAGMAETANAVAIELFERAPEGAAALQREFVHLSPTQLERHGPFFSKLASVPISDAMRQVRLLAAGGDPAVALLRATALSVRAAAALARTDWRDALQHYDRALEFDPENGAVRRSRALVRTVLGETAEAVDDLTRAIESEPGDSSSLGFRAQLLHASGRNEEALADITRAIALAPHDFLIADFGVRFHLLRGEFTEAARLARVIAENAGEYLDQLVAARRIAGATIDALRSKLGGITDPADPKAPLLRLAQTDRAAALASIEAEAFELESSASLAHGELEEALAAMNRALAVSPPHPRRLSRRAVILERLGRNDEALADARAVLATEPDHLPMILMSARLHLAADDLPSAIDHLRRAVALTPADYALRAWFAEVLGRADDLIGASTELDVVAEHAGEFLDQILEARARGIQDVAALNTTAERLAVARLLLDAERDRDAAIRTVRAEAASMRAQARLRDRDADGVVAALTEVIALGASGADTYALRGEMLRWLGRLVEAHDDLTRALALDESSAWAHGTMGQVLVALDRPGEALEYLDRAISLQPELGWARVARAELLGQLERLEESLAEFRTVLAAEPGNVRALGGLADRLRLLGRFDEALLQAEHGLAGAPDDPELRRQRALILHLL